ncbi:hypothetical protein V2G26_011993 [Clonostachys chloroleuca]
MRPMVDPGKVVVSIDLENILGKLAMGFSQRSSSLCSPTLHHSDYQTFTLLVRSRISTMMPLPRAKPTDTILG